MKCLIVEDDETTREIMEILVSKTPFLSLVKSCSNGLEASNVLLEKKIDLIFLDMIMPEMTGIELLKSLNGPKPQIIIITSKTEYAPEAFTLDVTDFIVKPVTKERFLNAVSKAKKIFDASNPTADLDIYVKNKSRLLRLNTGDILLVEALADYVTIVTQTGKFTVHSTMKSIEAKLPAGLFLRVHHSFIVRLDKITEIDENTIVIDKRLIPISRVRKQDLMDRLKVI